MASFEKVIKEFMEKNKLKATFQNSYINSHSLCYSYKYNGKLRYMSFIIMENDGNWTVLHINSVSKQFKKQFRNGKELQILFDKFLEFANKNEGLTLC